MKQPIKADEFKKMWEDMQKAGYFENHPHYSDHFGKPPTAEEIALDESMRALDFSLPSVVMPVPYSESLERSVKRTESFWLYRMFDLPRSGTALDLGCGFGRTVEWLCEVYDHVYASDISSEVIELARARLAEHGNISFHVNKADSLPNDIPHGAIDIAYIFTVFQHIPRAHALQLLSQVEKVLSPSGTVVFNLLSNVNQVVNDGELNTEWAIGYSEDQARKMVADAGLNCAKVVSWGRPENEIAWLWISATKQ